jgi:hypothetical protein
LLFFLEGRGFLAMLSDPDKSHIKLASIQKCKKMTSRSDKYKKDPQFDIALMTN